MQVAAYADDLTVVLGENDSLAEVINIINDFTNSSRLEINHEKSEVLPLNGREENLGNLQKALMIKVTGVWIGEKCTAKQRQEANFEPVVKKIDDILRLWKMRHLTLYGKALAIKSQALAQLQFLASMIKVPDKVLKKVSKLINRFLWNGPDKIKRVKVARAMKEGGLGLPQLQTFCAAAATQWIKRALMCPSKV